MATEDRWHDFAKEKPSEDMEGRNFIVSNGYSDTLSMWCGGYWENEPFMGNKLCDEVVRWKGYLTPEEEKANEATRTEPKPMKCDELKEYYYYEDIVITPSTHMYRVYHADKVDAAIAELKARIQLDDDEMAGFLQLEEEYGGGDLRNYIAELKAKLEEKDKEIAELKKKCEAEKSIGATFSENGAELARWVEELRTEIESLKASHYAESVDAGMANKKLQDELTKLKAQMPKYKEFIEDEDYRKKLVDEYAGYVYEWAGHRYVATPYINVFIKGILRTLYKALANWAKSERYTEATWHGDEHREELWAGVEERCRAKAEEYK